MKLYIFRAVPLPIIRSLFTINSAMVYVIQVCNSCRAGTSWSCSKAVYKPVWHIPLLSVQWINSWWWTEELSETRRFSCLNKFVRLVHLVGFIIKKYRTWFSIFSTAFVWNLFQYAVPGVFYYFVLWQTNAQLFHKLSQTYMFRHHRVIIRELVINTLSKYSSISKTAVGNTVYN